MESAHSKILLISDMPSKAIAYNQLFKGLGYEPVVAFSLSRALVLLRNNEFKVIVIEQNNTKAANSNDYRNLIELSNNASIKICFINKSNTDSDNSEMQQGVVLHADNQQAIAAELDRILG